MLRSAWSMWIQNGSAVTLVTKRVAGIAPEVNPRNPLLAGNKRCKGSTLALKPRADITRSPAQGISGPTNKDLGLSHFFSKTIYKCTFFLNPVEYLDFVLLQILWWRWLRVNCSGSARGCTSRHYWSSVWSVFRISCRRTLWESSWCIMKCELCDDNFMKNP